MYNIDFKNPGNVYFIGIGGISMSGFAFLLADRGFNVSGSDMKRSELTDRLEKEDIHVNIGQKAENITGDIDFIVYTAAIHKDNPEYAAGEKLGIPMLERAQLVGQVMLNYKHAIAVSGTHGKTTATSMISHIFMAADSDPTISVGGMLDLIGGNIRVGHSDLFITEACEYTNSFLKFHPTASVILNVDADHLDFFKDLDDIRHSFRVFAGLLPECGELVINGEIDDLSYITADCRANITTFGLRGNFDYMAEDITFDETGCCTFTLIEHGEKKDTYHLNVVGEHNVYNALAAIAISRFVGIPSDIIHRGLASFKGTHRRFEVKGKFNGVTVIDDYAHHPAEISATLAAASRYPHEHIWVVFQPHTYSRTKALLSEFADSLSAAEHVIVADIYAAREKDPGDISSSMLADRINAAGGHASYLGDFESIEKFIKKNCINGDLLITMGAGNVVDIGNDLLK